MQTPKLKLWTEDGIKQLGKIIKQSRIEMELSQKAMSDFIRAKTGYYVADTSIGDLEKGNKMPSWNTMAIVAGAGYVKHPLTKKFLSVDDFCDIAAEETDPFDISKLRESNRSMSHDLIGGELKSAGFKVDSSLTIAEIIRQIISDRGISVDRLARESKIMPPSRLREILASSQATDSEIAKLAATGFAIKADGSRWDIDELLQIAGLKAPASSENNDRIENNLTSNGAHGV